jgi:hypothetical protein
MVTQMEEMLQSRYHWGGEPQGDICDNGQETNQALSTTNRYFLKVTVK